LREEAEERGVGLWGACPKVEKILIDVAAETGSRHDHGLTFSSDREDVLDEVLDELGVSAMEVYLWSRCSEPTTAALHTHLWFGC
jgi:hypothetical protein